MSESCSHECGSCGEDCSERAQAPEDLRAPQNALSNVRKVIAVVSGKGGVGKSFVSSMMAVLMSRKDCRTAILDADVTGPSIPRSFGLTTKATGDGTSIFPVETKMNIKVMSLNLLLENDTDPVVWRGPIIANMVKQFWTDVMWGDVDYMFVDMPPGTGDVPLTVFQSLPVDGIIVVTSPQELVGMIVEKAVNMANMMNIPVLALVENMSYFKCPDCGKVHKIFGESHIEEIAKKYNISTVCRLPLDPQVAAAADNGEVEKIAGTGLEPIVDMLLAQQDTADGPVIRVAVPYEDGQIFQHFGHSEKFMLYDIKGGRVVVSQLLETNGSGHGALAGLLRENGADALICGGIGGGAIQALTEAGIQVYGGVTGSSDEAVAAMIAGKLDYDPDVHCTHHDHEQEGGCGEHEGSCSGHDKGCGEQGSCCH